MSVISISDISFDCDVLMRAKFMMSVMSLMTAITVMPVTSIMEVLDEWDVPGDCDG
jgi:hypothetical protein